MECSAIPARIIATSFAVASFAAAVLVGGFAGHPTPVVLWRALLVMGICWLVGTMIGYVAQRLVDAEAEAYRQSNPIPPFIGQPEQDEVEPGTQAQASNRNPSSTT